MKWHTDPTLYDRCCGDRPKVGAAKLRRNQGGPYVTRYTAYCPVCGDEVKRSTPLGALTAWNKRKRKEGKR
jgi:hypothetical protein